MISSDSCVRIPTEDLLKLLRYERRQDMAISFIKSCVFIYQEFCVPPIIYDNVSLYRITKIEAVFC